MYGCRMAGYHRCMGVVWLDIIDVWVSCGWDIDVCPVSMDELGI